MVDGGQTNHSLYPDPCWTNADVLVTRRTLTGKVTSFKTPAGVTGTLLSFEFGWYVQVRRNWILFGWIVPIGKIILQWTVATIGITNTLKSLAELNDWSLPILTWKLLIFRAVFWQVTDDNAVIPFDACGSGKQQTTRPWSSVCG